MEAQDSTIADVLHIRAALHALFSGIGAAGSEAAALGHGVGRRNGTFDGIQNLAVLIDAGDALQQTLSIGMAGIVENVIDDLV